MFGDTRHPSQRILLTTEFIQYLKTHNEKLLNTLFKTYWTNTCLISSGLEVLNIKKEHEDELSEYLLEFLKTHSLNKEACA